MVQTRHEIAERGLPIRKIAVVGVIALTVAFLAAYGFRGKMQESMIDAARMQAAAIGRAVETYKIDHGYYPASLDVLLETDREGKGPYVKTIEELHDPWGVAFHYDPDGGFHPCLDCLINVRADVFTVIPDGSDRIVGNWNEQDERR